MRKRKSGRPPANIIPFPLVPVRYWHVQPDKDRPGAFRGVLLGIEWDDFEGPTSTGAGPIEQVVGTLTARAHVHYRRGLPIVVGDAK